MRSHKIIWASSRQTQLRPICNTRRTGCSIHVPWTFNRRMHLFYQGYFLVVHVLGGTEVKQCMQWHDAASYTISKALPFPLSASVVSLDYKAWESSCLSVHITCTGHYEIITTVRLREESHKENLGEQSGYSVWPLDYEAMKLPTSSVLGTFCTRIF